MFQGKEQMSQSFPQRSLTERRILLGVVGLLFMLSAVILAVYGSRPNQEVSKQPDKAGEQLPAKPINASFFHETNVGRAVLGYLDCIDLDCAKFESEVVKAGRDAIVPLVTLLRDGLPREIGRNSSRDVRPKVIHLLGAIGDVRAVPHLIVVVQDKSPLVRAAVAGALGQIGGDQALNALPQSLQDSDQLVRETAAISLGRIGRSEALPALREAARVEPLPHVREAIYGAMRAIEKR